MNQSLLISKGWDYLPSARMIIQRTLPPILSGKTVSEIRDGTPSLRKFYDRVENVSIPVTILRCDMSKVSHSEYVFTIFHRLNTGGSKLNNQEIRNCIFSGPFNDLLAILDKQFTWRRRLRKCADSTTSTALSNTSLSGFKPSTGSCCFTNI